MDHPEWTEVREKEVWSMAVQLLKCVSRGVLESLEKYLSNKATFSFLGRDIRVSIIRIGEAIDDRIFKKVSIRGRPRFVCTGSRYEGLPGNIINDVDHMAIHHDFPVVLCEPYTSADFPELVEKVHGFVLAETSTNNPAFTRLRVEETDTDLRHSLLSRHEGRIYFSSEKFVSAFVDDDCVHHGPATTVILVEKVPECGEADDVRCLYSPVWPESAQEFLDRARPHGWPPFSLVDDIEEAGCHVVGVGHPSTERRDLEWRWSFSHAEKILLQDIHETIYVCYCLLKLLKRSTKARYKDVVEAEHIPSYFLKTACLWYTENTYIESSTSIISSVRNILSWLIECYNIHTLPHFFIREQNLIGHLTPETCVKAIKNLTEMKNIYLLPLIFSLQPDKQRFGEDKEDIDFDSFNQWIAALCNLENAKDILDRESKAIEPGSYLYNERELLVLRIHTCNDIAASYNTLCGRKLFNPEMVFLPVIVQLKNIVIGNSEYLQLYRKLLFLSLGEQCSYVARYCERYGTSEEQSFFAEYDRKAVSYFKEAIPLMYPTGRTDHGFTGYAFLAKYYYLNDQWESAEEYLDKCLRVSQESRSPALNILIPAVDSPIQLIWESDKILIHCLLSDNPFPFITISSFWFVTYLNTRRFIRQGRRQVAQNNIRSLLDVSEKMTDEDTVVDNFRRLITALMVWASCETID